MPRFIGPDTSTTEPTTAGKGDFYVARAINGKNVEKAKTDSPGMPPTPPTRTCLDPTLRLNAPADMGAINEPLDRQSTPPKEKVDGLESSSSETSSHALSDRLSTVQIGCEDPAAVQVEHAGQLGSISHFSKSTAPQDSAHANSKAVDPPPAPSRPRMPTWNCWTRPVERDLLANEGVPRDYQHQQSRTSANASHGDDFSAEGRGSTPPVEEIDELVASPLEVASPAPPASQLPARPAAFVVTDLTPHVDTRVAKCGKRAFTLPKGVQGCSAKYLKGVELKGVDQVFGTGVEKVFSAWETLDVEARLGRAKALWIVFREFDKTIRAPVSAAKTNEARLTALATKVTASWGDAADSPLLDIERLVITHEGAFGPTSLDQAFAFPSSITSKVARAFCLATRPTIFYTGAAVQFGSKSLGPPTYEGWQFHGGHLPETVVHTVPFFDLSDEKSTLMPIPAWGTGNDVHLMVCGVDEAFFTYAEKLFRLWHAEEYSKARLALAQQLTEPALLGRRRKTVWRLVLPVTEPVPLPDEDEELENQLAEEAAGKEEEKKGMKRTMAVNHNATAPSKKPRTSKSAEHHTVTSIIAKSAPNPGNPSAHSQGASSNNAQADTGAKKPASAAAASGKADSDDKNPAGSNAGAKEEKLEDEYGEGSGSVQEEIKGQGKPAVKKETKRKTTRKQAEENAAWLKRESDRHTKKLHQLLPKALHPRVSVVLVQHGLDQAVFSLAD
ncbi:hypothetical protein IAT38_004706 [Cryptococcus sp. DSM 104549]